MLISVWFCETARPFQWCSELISSAASMDKGPEAQTCQKSGSWLLAQWVLSLWMTNFVFFP